MSRHANDNYPTPEFALQALSRELGPFLRGIALEPCAGDRRIVRHFRMLTWTAFDIRDDPPVDFTTWSTFGRWDYCITNPPYPLAQQFVDRARACCDRVWMLLRLNFLGGQKRCEWWARNRPSHIWVLSKRPSFTGAGTDRTEYAWFGWCEPNAVYADVRVLGAQC